jgi:hypothetical protein
VIPSIRKAVIMHKIIAGAPWFRIPIIMVGSGLMIWVTSQLSAQQEGLTYAQWRANYKAAQQREATTSKPMEEKPRETKPKQVLTPYETPAICAQARYPSSCWIDHARTVGRACVTSSQYWKETIVECWFRAYREDAIKICLKLADIEHPHRIEVHSLEHNGPHFGFRFRLVTDKATIQCTIDIGRNSLNKAEVESGH